MTAKESRNRNYQAAVGTIFGISNCFQRNKQKNIFLFFHKAAGKFKSKGLQNIFIWLIFVFFTVLSSGFGSSNLVFLLLLYS
jgi:hypothetical protein